MPVDYSKWDALELSDDSDVDVHPNVDKRSFIRAKQNQIHMEREQRKNQIVQLKYERRINDALIQRISSLLNSLKAHAADVENGRNPGEIAFAAVMESAASLKREDDIPPERPAGLPGTEEKLPTYSKMMATLLDQVNKAIEEKKVKDEDRYAAMVTEIQDHLDKVTNLQSELHQKLDELEKEDVKKITSESIHTGFDSSHVNKSSPSASGEKKEDTQVELLNPNFSSSKPDEAGSSSKKTDDDEEVEASPAAKKFADIKAGSYNESLAFLGKHPEILKESETDGLLVLAFDAQLDGREDYAKQAVHQALLLQYCRSLGRDGVGLFFKRIMTPGHQAQGVFLKDVHGMYTNIKTRAAEINKQRAASASGLAEGEGVEQIQLHAVEPGTVINIHVPPENSADPDEQEARNIFEGFSTEMKKALESGSLEEVNKVLGNMKVEDAEELIGKFGEAGVLSLEQEIIDATTKEGQAEWEQLQEQGKGTTSESQYADDPE
ncbi:hypothetical protein VPNG_03918 [Cytospora leucostoma]|uniref:Hsp90 chaperone protein kinase-targeting subunit n=1 Tax=Cytospora leucostoma TaxID=1230097 RepID=A0A423XEG0_9PEZI|nr:hypothetical protein VPNG_03918 [Cytospora leucostoma]